MTPLEASAFIPDKSTFVQDDEVTIPDVDCGDGYRQLKWREPIETGDEFFGGRDGDRKWVPVSIFSVDCLYRPHTANSIYAPWAITRRRI